MSLLAGELRRVLARRLVKVLALVVLGSCLLAGVLVFLNTESLPDADAAARRGAAQARVQQCLQGEQPDFRRAGVGPPVGSPDREEFCRFAVGRVDDPRFRVRTLKGILQGTTAAGVIVAWIIGASVIGSDWQTRTLTTLLTWEPRRVRVLLGKALATTLVAVVFALLGQALLTAALLPSAVAHGTTAGVDSEWARGVAGVLGRGSLLVAVGAAIGFSVASIGRNTAAALGIGFGYFFIVENVVGSFLAGLRRWLLLGNAIVLVSGENGGGEVSGRSVVVAGIYLAAVGVALLAGATTLFKRRDVA